jgi:hypothetical protein
MRFSLKAIKYHKEEKGLKEILFQNVFAPKEKQCEIVL